MHLKYFYFFCFFIFSVFCANAQEIKIVSVSQKGSKINVTYDLVGPKSNYNVNLYIVPSRTTLPLSNVSGDVGPNQKVGTNKVIIWDVLSDRKELIGKYQFTITAYNTSKARREDAEKEAAEREAERLYKKKSAELARIRKRAYEMENNNRYSFSYNFGKDYLPINITFNYFDEVNLIGFYSGITCGGTFKQRESIFEIENGVVISYDGDAVNPDYVFESKNQEDISDIYFNFGANVMHRYPIWVSGGFGFGYHRVVEFYDFSYSFGGGEESFWIRNKDRSKFRFYPELDFHIKIKNAVVFSFGAAVFDYKLKPRFGIGIAFY